MLSYLTFLILSLLLTNPCPYRVAGPNVRVELDEEEYAIYSALLNEKYIEGRTNFLIVVDQTVAKPSLAKELERDDLQQMLLPISPLTVAAFKGKNKEAQALKGALNLKVRYILLRNREWGEFFRGDVIRGWEEFYRRNPGATGYIRLSRVGINPNGHEALAYVEHGCGATCGTGNYVLLTNRGKEWKVEKMVMLWIA
jgi:hypothetical protein